MSRVRRIFRSKLRVQWKRRDAAGFVEHSAAPTHYPGRADCPACVLIPVDESC